MDKSMGLDFSGADMTELDEDHNGELILPEISELQSQQQETLAEPSTEEDEKRPEVSSGTMKYNVEKWSECQDFFEKHCPNITLTEISPGIAGKILSAGSNLLPLYNYFITTVIDSISN